MSPAESLTTPKQSKTVWRRLSLPMGSFRHEKIVPKADSACLRLPGEKMLRIGWDETWRDWTSTHLSAHVLSIQRHHSSDIPALEKAHGRSRAIHEGFMRLPRAAT